MGADRQIRLLILALVAVFIGSILWVVWDYARIERERTALAAQAPSAWIVARTGMSRRQIVSLLGEPPSVDSFSTPIPPSASAADPVPPAPKEQWRYAFGESGPSLYSGRYVIDFTNGTVERVSIQ